MTDLPETVEFSGRRVTTFKGENGWQSPAGLYADVESTDPLAVHKFVRLAGPEPSFNNWCDVDRLLQTMTHAQTALDKNARQKRWNIALGAKHGNCCGAGCGTQEWAMGRMIEGDVRAIFGGVVMTNFAIDEVWAIALMNHATTVPRFLSAVVAPRFSENAISVLKGTRDRCTVLANPSLEQPSLDGAPRFRYVRGGFLKQPNYSFVPVIRDATCSGNGVRQFELIADLAFAWAIGSTSNSNTITIVRDGMLLGNGVGQQDRVGAAELAIKRALDAEAARVRDEKQRIGVKGSVAYSDSFFPFPDGPERLVDAGVWTIMATSGSVQDENVRKAIEAKGGTLLTLPDGEARGFFGH
jgi:phosphoribosylaminoimidazolecarboxamide formyltransferase/IMP cyclohydrolase